MARLLWTRSAKNAILEIQSIAIRQKIRDVARLVKDYPQMHPPVRTKSWGLAGHFLVAPFIVIYQFSENSKQCTVLDVLHQDYFASRERQP